MSRFFEFYKIINALSLDVALGAMICASFFAKVFHSNVFPVGIALLGIAVWIIYTIDHLLDAHKLKTNSVTFRHQFHQQHFKLLVALLIIAIIFAVTLLFFIRQPLFINGIGFGLLTGLYVLINRWLYYLKEMVSAMLYAGGVLLPSLTFHEHTFANSEWWMMLQFFLIVIINLILFSWKDFERDKGNHHHSIVTLIGEALSARLLWILFILSFGLCGYQIILGHPNSILWLSMATILLIIFLTPRLFRDEFRFRFLGDAIFFLPVLPLLL